MADYGSAAQALGTTPQMLASNSGAFTPPMPGQQQGQKSFVDEVGGDEKSKFAQWFQSEGTQVMIGGLFDAIGSLGAGMAGISPGGLDRSSVARGAANAQGAWDRSQKRWDMKQFGQFIDKRLVEERKKGKPDNDKIMTLEMLKRNPEAGIQAYMDKDNWKEKADYGFTLGQQKIQAGYDRAQTFAITHYEKMIPAEMKAKLLNGDAKAMQNLLNRPGMTEYFPYLIAEGGPLHAVVQQALEKKDGSMWETVRGWLGFGDEEEGGYATSETGGGMSVGSGDYATSDIPGASVGTGLEKRGIGAGFLLPSLKATAKRAGSAESESFMERAAKGDYSLYPDRPF